MKKILKSAAAFLSVIVLLTVLSPSLLTVNAAQKDETFVLNDFEFILTNTNTTSILSYKGTSADIEIPSIIGGRTVVTIGENAFNENEYVRSIKVPSSVTTIENGAFSNSPNLERVSFSDGLITIGDNAFANSEKLFEIVIPDTVVNLGENIFSNTAWYNCQPDGIIYIGTTAYEFKGSPAEDGIVRIKDGTKVIPKKVFYQNSEIKTVYIPDSVTQLDDYVFAECTNLEKVYYGSGISKVPNYAFSGCISLKSIDLPETITEIGNYSFLGCESVKTLEIPEQITSIGMQAFKDCKGIETVNYNAINSKNSITSTFKWFFSWDKENFPKGRNRVTIADEDYTVYLHYSPMFEGCDSFKILNIGKNVKRIYDYTFVDCKSLETVNYNALDCTEMRSAHHYTIYYYYGNYSKKNSYTTTDSNFLGCDSLTTINIGEDVKSITEYSFADCENLKTVNFNAEMCTIAGATIDSAFGDCINLTDVNIGEKVQSITGNPFLYCPSLERFNVDESNQYLTSVDGALLSKNERILFICPNNADSYTLPKKVTEIKNYAFWGCGNLNALDVAEGNINYKSEDNAILSINGFHLITAALAQDNYTIPESVKYIDSYAFFNRTKLKEITFPDELRKIGNRAFQKCNHLTSITIPDKVITIEDAAFANCSNITEADIGNGLSVVPDSMFFKCNNLKTVNLGERVTTINVHAFYQCTSLDYIYVPGSVTSIDTNAFRECKYFSFYAYDNTYAQTYANSKDIIDFVSLGEYVPVELPDITDVTLGDVDGDEVITVKDATLLQKYIAELSSLDDEQLEAADTNKDKVVNILDVTLIQKYAASIIDSF